MNKKEIVDAVANASGQTKVSVETTLNHLLDTISTTMSKGESVTLLGFGTFEPKTRAARSGRNPKTGETIQISEARVPAFKAGKSLKDAVNEAKPVKAPGKTKR